MLLLALCALAFPGTLRAQQQSWWEMEPLNDQGWVEFDTQTGLAYGTNGIIVRYGSAYLTADQVSANQQSGDVVADGNVHIQSEDQLWAGEHIRYNFITHQMQAEQFRTGRTPVFMEGEGLRGLITNRVYTATNAVITTDDVSEPAIKVRAKYIKIIPGEKVVAHSATLYLGGVPIFYFPYYSRDIGPRANNFNFVPGYRSSFGPFLMSSYHFFIGDVLDGSAHVDYRERRGAGMGPTLNYHLGKWGDGTFKYYYLHDDNPGAGGGDPKIDPNRQRFDFSYQADPATNLNVKAVVRYQGDTNIVREFFEGEYRLDPQPDSFFEVNRFWQNFSADTYVQPQVNNFLETEERLPDVRLNGMRQQLWETPVYYESVSSAGYYRHQYGKTNGVVDGLNYEAARVDSYQKLLAPHTFFDWLNVTPRVGGRYTYYGAATGPGANTDDQSRWVFDTGAETSAKASAVWPGVQNDFFEVDGLRHIIEPSINYAYVPNPNVYGTNHVPQFDYQLPSLRLLPITFPDYNSIDSIQGENVFRFGLHNKLQTKREGQVVNLVDVWRNRAVDSSRERSNQMLVVGVREANGETLYLCPEEAHAPHTLIAGTTGSGKSILIQNLLLDIPITNDCANARIILIDPKQGADYLDLRPLQHIHEGIIVTQDQARATLEWAVEEMDRRYGLFHAAGVANLVRYNAQVSA